MRTFRLLEADEIECRLNEVDKNGKFVKLLLYKTARTDSALMDETFGATNWQCDYKVIDGNLYCGVAVNNGGEWIWKWNVGTESNMEAEKGQASDALKRACFVWGLGAELYTGPEIKLSNLKCNIKEYAGKYKCYDKFTVKEIGYDEKGCINKLIIYNENTMSNCYEYGNSTFEKPAPKVYSNMKPETDIDCKCSKCGTQISKKVYDFSVSKYGKPLCMNCQKEEG